MKTTHRPSYRAGYRKPIKPTPEQMQSPFQDPGNYANFVEWGKVFADSLRGDGGYEKTEINFIALENRLIGYMSTQEWFFKYEKYLRENFKRDNIWLHAADAALQAAQDAVTTIDPQFRLQED